MTSAREIVLALDGRWNGHDGMARCPAHNDRTPSLSVSEEDGRTLLYCHAGCHQDAVIEALRARNLWVRSSFQRNPGVLAEATTQAARRIWEKTVPANHTLAERYLSGRGIFIPPPAAIRFHPKLKHSPSGFVFPALVAGIQNAHGDFSGIVRIFLSPDGRGKADVNPSKMELGEKRNNTVRCAEPTDTIWLCEGIEDALSVLQMFNQPAWAALGASNLSNVQLPHSVRRVVLAPDNDETGRRAIQDAAPRFYSEKREVLIATPKVKDWNEALALFEERAGIREFDGGELRNHARDAALREVTHGHA